MGTDQSGRKKSSKKPQTKQKRRASNDGKSHDDPHIKVERMFPAETSTSKALVQQGRQGPQSRSTVHPKQEASDSDASFESEEETHHQEKKRKASEQQQEYIPTDDEIRRMHLYLQLKASAATIPARKGHTYRKVKVSENAIVIQGNAFDSDRPEAQLLARDHEYLETEAADGSLINGDVTTTVMKLLFDRHKTSDKQRNDQRKNRPQRNQNDFQYGE